MDYQLVDSFTVAIVSFSSTLIGWNNNYHV